MSMEEKNEWLINYVNSLTKQINEQYGNIVHKEHIDKLISEYKDSDKEMEEIKDEIDKKVEEFIKKYLNNPYDDNLLEKLRALYDSEVSITLEGQKIIKQYGIDSSEAKEILIKAENINKENLKEVEFLIQKYGWIGSNIEDKKGSQAMWLIIQHADLDSQLKYYPLMQQAVSDNKETIEHLYELEDRILIKQGKEQLHNTQYEFDNNGYVLSKNNEENIKNFSIQADSSVLYHGSSDDILNRLEPHESTHGNYLYATKDKNIAIIFSQKCGNDNTFFLGRNDKTEPYILVERIPEAFNTMFNNSSFVYTIDGKNFKNINTGFDELVSEVGANIINKEYIPNLYEKIKELAKEGKIKLYTYDQRMNQIPSDSSDLIAKEFKQLERRNKKLSEKTFDNLIYYHPYLMDKVNTILKENNVNFQYDKEKLVELFENKVIKSEININEEQFIKSSYINITKTYPELTQKLNEKLQFKQKTKDEKISILIEKLNIPEIKERYVNENRNFEEIGKDIINYFKEKQFYQSEEIKFKQTEDAINMVNNTYIYKFENCDMNSLRKLNIIYTYNKIDTALNMTPKGVSKEYQLKVNEEIEKAKQYLNQEIKDVFKVDKIDNLELFISNLKENERSKNDSAYNVLMQYKESLKKAYKENNGEVKIILPTQNLKEIKSASHRENQFLNEIVDGVYSVGSYDGLIAYTVRANAESMIANKEAITLPKNPFDITKSNNEVLSLQKPVSIYSSSVDYFEPVVDFSLTKDNKINLRFDNEWISRQKSVKCTEKVVNNLPGKILEKRNIIVKDNNQNINIKDQISNKKGKTQIVENTKNNKKQISTKPDITVKRKEEKQTKSTRSIKMNNTEKQIYPALKQKQEIKKQTKKQSQNKVNIKTLNNTSKGTSNAGNNSKGYISIILTSLIVILIVLCIFILIR